MEESKIGQKEDATDVSSCVEQSALTEFNPVEEVKFIISIQKDDATNSPKGDETAKAPASTAFEIDGKLSSAEIAASLERSQTSA